jgi:hypothetical protein
MNKDLLNKVGGIVASEVHGLSTWMGDTNRFYIKTNIDPKTLHFNNLKKHIVEIQEDEFEGSFWIIAFNAT